MELNKEELFADIFAYRIYLQDIYENERDIIKKLKIRLYNSNVEISYINSFLFEFYQFYNIPISQEEIENAHAFLIFNTNNNNNENTTNNNNAINRILSRLHVYNGLFNIHELLNNINVNQNETENETINENDFNNNFEIFEYKKTKEDETETDECSICIDTIQEGQEVVKLPCKHLYHSSCIKSYLLNYNNKCPLCRNSCMN